MVNCSCYDKGALAGIKDPGPLEDAITRGDLKAAKKLLRTAKSGTESQTKSETESGKNTKTDVV